MRKAIILAAAALTLLGCSQQWNDLVHTEVVAEILTFGIEGQVKSEINRSGKSIDVLLPWDADPANLTLSEFTVTEGAVCTPALKAGGKIDLSAPLTVTLHTYDDYIWTVTATLKPKPTSDIYNMTFDLWSKDFFEADVCYGEDADSDMKETWGSVNVFLNMIGSPNMKAEKEFVAEVGEGKAAVKLISQGIEALSTFFGGSIFNGTVAEFLTTEYTARFGVPFTKHPLTLEGYACYQPKNIDYSEAPYTDKQGTLDNGFVLIVLTDWDEPKQLAPTALLDVTTLPGLVGYAKVVFDSNMTAYEKFSATLTYVNDHTPKYAVIMASSSALGDYHTGGNGSVLYLDELGFTY